MSKPESQIESWPDRLAYIGLGANLGEPLLALQAAAASLAALPGVSGSRLSPLYRTRPVDAEGPDFLNAVVELRTRLSAHHLWHHMQAIEQEHGRERPYRNAPRTLDLDLLWFDQQVLDTHELIVPHPRLHLRAFALQPLADLDSTLLIQGRTVIQWLQEADATGMVRLPD